MTEIERISFIDSILWSHTRNGLTAAATKHFLNWQFYGLPEVERRKIFKTNVANNILYASNSALIDNSIVAIVEHIKFEDKVKALPFALPDLDELKKHRVVISHPATVEFSDKKVQAFFDSHGQYRDPVALRIWRLRQTFVDWLSANGAPAKFSNEVVFQSGTVELIQGSLNLSLNPDQAPHRIEEIWAVVPDYFKTYGDTLKKSAAKSV